MAEQDTITHESFRLLLGWLDANDEAAGEKYESIRQRLIRIFVGRGCHEAEMLADQTMDRVARKITQLNGSYVGEQALYFYGVANKIHLEWLRQQKRSRLVTPVETGIDDDADDREVEYDCLELCLSRLPADTREMIVEYYRDERQAKIERRKQLARELGISIGALQIRASRLRGRLLSCVRDCASKSRMKGFGQN
jgi:DNA-directed RNA polymerase specialized sigma24 family protein